MGTDLSHSCYIKNFLVAQPIPSPLGWLACRLPLPLFQVALIVMFAVECIAPLFLLPTGVARAVASLAIAALMLGIQLGGNFGFFNILTAALCIGCLDTTSSALDALPAASFAEVLMRTVLAAYALLGGVFLVFDSWCSTAWAYWAQLALARKPAVRALVALCRFVSDQRLVHAYGVFPPASNPPIRMATVFEGSIDEGKTWRRYEWKYLPSAPHSAPAFVAPYHPRVDHSIFYVSLGVGPDNFLATINSPRPYGLAHDSLVEKIAQLLLDGNDAGNATARRLFKRSPFAPSEGAPRHVRARLIGLEATDVHAALSSGIYWRETILAEHLPVVCVDGLFDGQLCLYRSTALSHDGKTRNPSSDAYQQARTAFAPQKIREPLLFHPDLMPVWRERCPKLQALLSAPLAGASSGPSNGTRRSRSPARRPSSSADAAPAGGGLKEAPAADAAGHIAQLSVEDIVAATAAATPDSYARARSNPSAAQLPSAAELAEEFWSDFVPRVRGIGATSTWAAGVGVAARASKCRNGWSRKRIQYYEVMLCGVVLRMMPVLEERHMSRSLPLLGGAAPSYLHLVLLAHCLVLRGREAASKVLLGDTESDASRVTLEELHELGLCFFAILWTEKLLFHAHKFFVAGEMQRKYNEPMRFGHPALLPGFLVLLPHVAAALRPLVWSDAAARAFPQWEPPAKLGDWRKLRADEAPRVEELPRAAVGGRQQGGSATNKKPKSR